MLYERLHPNPEYNGIIGRFIFLEKISLHNHFPISIFLNDVKC